MMILIAGSDLWGKNERTSGNVFSHHRIARMLGGKPRFSVRFCMLVNPFDVVNCIAASAAARE